MTNMLDLFAPGSVLQNILQWHLMAKCNELVCLPLTPFKPDLIFAIRQQREKKHKDIGAA
jgi:hypothetical protein